jgi:hypothetical protein
MVRREQLPVASDWLPVIREEMDSAYATDSCSPSAAPASYGLPRSPHEQLYVVTAVFNPRGFTSRYRLYRDFSPYVADSGAQLVTVELSFADRPFEVTVAGNPWHLQLRTSDFLWHKERLLNLGIQHLLRIVPSAKYIAWVDADVTFSRRDWVDQTIKALNHHAIVQPFGEAINLGPDEQQIWACPSAFRKFYERGFHRDPPLPWSAWGGGHPGLAWAARRETLDQLGGLIDFCIAGSGDTHMANALMGLPRSGVFNNPGADSIDRFSPGFIAGIERWAQRCQTYVRQNVGYVPGACLHHWHGKSEQRGYTKRWDIARYHQFDPAADLITDAQGCWRWSGANPRLEQDISRSLSSRNEDSIDS